MEVDVRECEEADLDLLEVHAPTGANRYHESRFRRQQAGSSTFLIAWSGGIPVGSGEVLREGPREPAAARLYLRLGYRETGCRYDDQFPWIDEAGVRHVVVDPCRFLTKTLA
ncbi:hypothetical protein [Actinoplanes sp. DH11]|uniref:hypothetical protein n=1 Tax=Actinoplanes sp. DH11 TaxID=2857011 RepID=UPI001E3A2EFC|nr:hypothetical protein [Actinoplanes sp. DH11]